MKVYCDGSCLNNGKPNARAGYGIYFGENDSRNKAGKLEGSLQTNNRAELMAIYETLKMCPKGDIEIITDSNLAVKTFTEWINTWKKSKWWKSCDWTHKDAKKNCDLISEIDNLIQSRQGKVSFKHVYGHQSLKDACSAEQHRETKGNIEADKLANEGALMEPIKETKKEPIKETKKEPIKEPIKETKKEPIERLRQILEKYKVPESKIKKIISEWQEPNE